MDKDTHLLFESYKTVHSESMPAPVFASLAKHANSKLPSKELYTYEKVATMLPKDIEQGKEGENTILNKGAEILAKLIFNGDVKRASKMMYYDEDFNSDLISAYRHYQKNGFPSAQEDAESPGDVKRKKDNESRWMSSLMNHFRKEYRREGVDPYLEFFERYSPYHEDWVIKKFADMYNNTWASDPASRIDVEHFIKVKNDLREKKDVENEKHRSGAEEEERRLDPKCWKGYHKQGTKVKDGVRVNNCVKNS